jgi:hypothetical protein
MFLLNASMPHPRIIQVPVFYFCPAQSLWCNHSRLFCILFFIWKYWWEKLLTKLSNILVYDAHFAKVLTMFTLCSNVYISQVHWDQLRLLYQQTNPWLKRLYSPTLRHMITGSLCRIILPRKNKISSSTNINIVFISLQWF